MQTATKKSNCSISLTPQATKEVLSKMKLPTIPNIAVNALNIMKNASYSQFTHSSSK